MLKRARDTWEEVVFACLCVCVSICETGPSSEGLAALSSPASAILLRALLGQTSSVCLLCLFRSNHFSHICRLVMAATKPIPACAYSITEGSWELFCLSAPSQRLCTDILKQSHLLVWTCDVWAFHCAWGLHGNSAHPVQKFLEVCFDKKKKKRKFVKNLVRIWHTFEALPMMLLRIDLDVKGGDCNEKCHVKQTNCL